MSAQFPKVVQVTSGRFHQFDLARQLEKRGLLRAIYTGYPRWKLRDEGLPSIKIKTCPWLQVPRMALARSERARRTVTLLSSWNLRLIDRYAATTMGDDVDAVIAMSSHGAFCGPRIQRAGGVWICVRGSTHIRHQDEVLQAEHRRWGRTHLRFSEPLIAREEEEYARADRIAVPSGQVWRTFLARGVAAERLALVPYGVDLSRFYPVGQPPTDEFRIVFAGALSLRKGLGHLLKAFALFRHPLKRLLLAGPACPETVGLLRDAPSHVQWLGALPQPKLRELLSRAHVMVLCSIEEGLANVLAQALACGCPVVATEATGAADLFSDGVEGFIIPEADAVVVAERLDRLADDRSLRQRMSEAGLRRVRELGGWDHYGDTMESLIRSLWRCGTKI